MSNKEIADIFYKLAIFLEMDKKAFKPQAHERAGASLEALKQDVYTIYKNGGLPALEQIPGVGRGLAFKIEEYLKTGRLREYEDYKRKLPVKLDELLAVEGIGPQKIKFLYQKLGITDIKSLARAAKQDKIAGLPGFGKASEENIIEAIAFLSKSNGRFLLAEILPLAEEIVSRLEKLKEVKQISLAGSLRRMKETAGDVDILAVASSPDKVMDFFVNFPGVVKVWARGRTKSSVRVGQGFDIDLRLVPEKSYGSALQYFTGSKEHNIALRVLAMSKGLKLNEYGLFNGSKMIGGRTEKGIYRLLGLSYIEPEIREDKGELQNKQPRLITLNEVKGDLHCHSEWASGDNSILEMAQAAMLRGYQYIGISDHTKFLRIENGLDEKQLSEQRKEIDALNVEISKYRNADMSKFRILQGAEVNILNDGRIDINDQALSKLDYVIAGVHSSLKMPKQKMTERIIRAMKNPYVKIISHPTGRLIMKRDEYQLDFDRFLRATKETNAILEINSSPKRLDLNDQNIRRAKQSGVKMIINTDSHQKEQLEFMKYGVAQARRGWAESKDIVNTLPLAGLLKVFSMPRERGE
ncbi:MAG: DNA polymerase/3'-5' exonuclease PolX [Patescibacteria group bacterium]